MSETNRPSLFLTRQIHDDLIRNCPEWMRENFPKFGKVWSLAGVRVRGSESQVAELVGLVAGLPEIPVAPPKPFKLFF